MELKRNEFEFTPDIYLDFIRENLTPDKLFNLMRVYDEGGDKAYYPTMGSNEPIPLELNDGSAADGRYAFSYTLTHGEGIRAKITGDNATTPKLTGVTELTVSILPAEEGGDFQPVATVSIIGVTEHGIHTPDVFLSGYIINVDPLRDQLTSEINLAIYGALVNLNTLLNDGN